jgi:hydrogenase maturation protease
VNVELIEEIANAILYEGYMLYPYRPSSVKNRQRWNFGVVYPRNYSEAQQGTDPWYTRTECLVQGNAQTGMTVKVRFLQAISRTVRETSASNSVGSSEAKLSAAPAWQEGAERDAIVETSFNQLVNASVNRALNWPPSEATESLCDADGQLTHMVVRTQESISGRITLSASPFNEQLYKVTVEVANEGSVADPRTARRDSALMRSLLSAHSILSLERGEFVSLLDTPEELKEYAAQCKNVGTWPVLVGEQDQREAMLSSPIILYDYPQIAPESAGDLFEGTEIDEILALRILTLTEAEKHEMRQGDERARQILERTEALPEEQFLKLHGVLRGMRPALADHQEEPQ